MAVDQFQTDETGTMYVVFYDAGGLPVAVDTAISIALYDSGGTLRATYTNATTPSVDKITGGTPDPHYKLASIPLTGYTHGLVRAVVTATVGGDPVVPNPFEIDAAFEVIADGGALYTTAAKVKEQIPFDKPTELTDDIITGYIEDVGRWIDAKCKKGGYTVPFPAITDTPATPRLVSHMTREGAVELCMMFMGMVGNNVVGRGPRSEWVKEMLMELVPDKGRATMFLDESSDTARPASIISPIPVNSPTGDDIL